MQIQKKRSMFPLKSQSLTAHTRRNGHIKQSTWGFTVGRAGRFTKTVVF